MKNNKWLLAALIAIAVILWFSFDLGRFFTLEAAKQSQLSLQAVIESHPFRYALGYFLIYVAVTALSLPGAAIMTLLGGALFGFAYGLVLVSFASSLGATLAFLFSRFILRDWVQAKFGNRLSAINQGIEKQGAFYLFTLRLIPIFPFFVVNLLMGLTPMKTRQFYWVSQLGMLAGTAVYVNAGTQLAEINSLGDIVSTPILLSFALLGLFPLIAKKFIAMVQSKQVYQGWNKPTHFDTNMVVIGAGSGGLVSAYIAAAVKAKVTLIEKHQMGGDCLNTGCVPSKALIRAAHTAREVNRASEFGVHTSPSHIDFNAIMQRVKQVISQIEPHDSVERYQGLGVDCIQGEAKITSPWTVTVNNREISTENIVIATGARPLVPMIEGLDKVLYYTSDTIWELTELPSRLLVLGGGPIGCELAQSFALLGADVTLVEMAEQVLIREDSDVAEQLQQQLSADGVKLLTDHKVVSFSHDNGQPRAQVICNDVTTDIAFDAVLLALGRSANVSGFGLETLNIPTTERGTIEVNEYLQTRYPNIFAVGDVCGPFQLTHAASHQAWYAAVNGLFGQFKRFKADYRVMPHATYTTPEIARVGINEKEAAEQGLEIEVTQYGIDDLDRAIADGEAHGMVKVITPKGKDTILGVTIVGVRASDLLTEFTLAMKHGLGLNKILGTIHPYPTMSEANKYAAGVWKRNNAPQQLLAWVQKYHQWRRGTSNTSSVKDLL
uniref:dihydrolipoyl dehydrogenase n=1 Tax=Thaumasiovibrio occultus TaxID=1891184 RepID=UPI000B35A9D7|nr:dihydrolipoyl dehydrogenase [Thaumasiovibrio occultus]